MPCRSPATGGPEVLVRRPTWADPEPGPGELLVDVAAAGRELHRHLQAPGVYAVDLPYVPGGRAAAPCEAVGPGEPASGSATGGVVLVPGGYAERVVVPAAVAVPGARRASPPRPPRRTSRA